MADPALYCKPECKHCPNMHETVLKLNQMMIAAAKSLACLDKHQFGVTTHHDEDEEADNALLIRVASLRQELFKYPPMVQMFVKGTDLVATRKDERARLRYEVFWEDDLVQRGYVLPFLYMKDDETLKGVMAHHFDTMMHQLSAVIKVMELEDAAAAAAPGNVQGQGGAAAAAAAAGAAAPGDGGDAARVKVLEDGVVDLTIDDDDDDDACARK
jgi:hypothetical protein